MTIALIDDSDSDIQLLHDYLSRYCHEHHVYMTIEKFTNEHIFLNSMKQKAYAIDLSGGVETDGQKDPKKIAEIVQIARRYRR